MTIRKFFFEFYGFLLIALGVILGFAIYYYDLDDQSLNVFGDFSINNKFGMIGSYVSDIFIQLFGISSIFCSIFLIVWGIKFIYRGSNFNNSNAKRFRYRFLSLILLLPILDFLLSFIDNKYINHGLTVALIRNKNLLSNTLYIKAATILLVLIFFFVLVFFSLGIPFSLPKFKKSKLQIKAPLVSTKKAKDNKGPVDQESKKKDKNRHSNKYFEKHSNKYSEKHSDNHFNKHFNNHSDNAIFSGIYTLPNVNLIDEITGKGKIVVSKTQLEIMSKNLENVLGEFGISGEIVKVRPGPVVTLFELRPSPGTKTSRVIGLSEDIARSMSALSARIATVPGQNVIGIELPNPKRETVYLRDLLEQEIFYDDSFKIPLILGKDTNGEPVIADLSRMPHLLVAGTTGSGKSVSINVMILSILFRMPPDKCRLIMIDPKMLELSMYDGIPHLLCPVVTDPKKAVMALKWAVKEMENRYRCMSQLNVRNIEGYNEKLQELKNSGEIPARRVQTGFDEETGKPIFENQVLELTHFPYIVVVVDEMADLMLVAGKDIEQAVQRLAQMARAAGIHLIMATQRPSVDVITGTIKANFPTRISFHVTSRIDSRTILGEQGAEQLLGQGDMLYMSGGGRVMRVHGPFIKDLEVERIVEFLRSQGSPEYMDEVTKDEILNENSPKSQDEDDMYSKAVEIILNDRKISISYIQRKLQIGYNRSARIVEEMEKRGVVSAPNKSGKREILQ